MSHNLAIITTVYENYTVLEDFLGSLKKQSDRLFHLFITDLSKTKKKISTDVPHTIITSNNLGYAHGVNMGISEAVKQGFDSFTVMNNDTYFEKDFVKHVKKSLETHPQSIIGGKIYYAPGYEYHKDRYTKKDLGKILWYAGGSIDWGHVLTPHRGVDEIDTHQYEKIETTGFVNGALMIFDKPVYDLVGPWDESYFLYYEDSDYCVRAQKKGVTIYYDPSIVIWHKISQSTGGSGSKLHQTYQEKNRLKFGMKYAPLRTKLHLLKNAFFSIKTR